MSTGGLLNFLNGKYGTSAAQRTVPIMSLIRNHKPKSRVELRTLVESHSKEPWCKCGIKSKGSVKDFGKLLFDVQLREWRERRFTLEQCEQWTHDLFITNSLKGDVAERQALDILSKELPSEWEVKESSNELDCEYRVDLVINGNEITTGVQVKPETYKRTRDSVKKMNESCNRKWNCPVFYYYYKTNSADDGVKFTNTESLLKDLLSEHAR